jgi:CheY-like chemotaxis protein
MNAQGLILSRDEKVSTVFRHVFDSAGVTLHRAALAGEALNLLTQNKYDAVVVNCADWPEGYDVLSALRNGRSNRTSIAFAVTSTNTSVKMAYDAGATFVVAKPITPESVSRAMRVAYGLILRERRRYLRHPLNISMLAKFRGEVRDNPVRLVNVSEGGIAIATGLSHKVEGKVGFKFRLPSSKNNIAGTGGVVWIKEQGHLGISFAALVSISRMELDTWLEHQTKETLLCPSVPFKR